MDYRSAYEMIIELQHLLQTEFLTDAAWELQHDSAIRSAPDYRKVHALSATFTLQEFFSNAIAQAEADGKLQAKMEGVEVVDSNDATYDFF